MKQQRVRRVWKCSNKSCRRIVAIFEGTVEGGVGGGTVEMRRPFTYTTGAILCTDCFEKKHSSQEYKAGSYEDLKRIPPDVTTMEDKGGCSEMASTSSSKQDSYLQVTVFTVLQANGMLPTEYAIDVLLAYAEAERQVNEWLDILRKKRAPKAEKERARASLAEHSEEYQWLVARRGEIEHLLQLATQ